MSEPFRKEADGTIVFNINKPKNYYDRKAFRKAIQEKFIRMDNDLVESHLHKIVLLEEQGFYYLITFCDELDWFNILFENRVVDVFAIHNQTKEIKTVGEAHEDNEYSYYFVMVVHI